MRIGTSNLSFTGTLFYVWESCKELPSIELPANEKEAPRPLYFNDAAAREVVSMLPAKPIVLRTHQGIKFGEISEAWIDGGAVKFSGINTVSLDPRQCWGCSIQAEEVHISNMKAKVWEVRKVGRVNHVAIVPNPAFRSEFKQFSGSLCSHTEGKLRGVVLPSVELRSQRRA